MSDDVVKSELARLSKLFNTVIKLDCDFHLKYDNGESRRHEFGLGTAWKIETGIAAIDWDKASGHGAFPVWSQGATAEEALDSLKAKTVDKLTGFLLSTHTYGYRFADVNNRGPHIIQHWKGDAMIEEFPYDEEKVLTLLKETNPLPEPEMA